MFDLNGFPSDFPFGQSQASSLFVTSDEIAEDTKINSEINFNETNTTENIDQNQKRRKIVLESASVSPYSYSNDDGDIQMGFILCNFNDGYETKKHVQFSNDPPVEFPTFTKFEYDRSPSTNYYFKLNPFKKGATKDYYSLWRLANIIDMDE